MTQILLAISAIVNLLLLILLIRALVQLNDAEHLCAALKRDRNAYRAAYRHAKGEDEQDTEEQDADKQDTARQ